MEIKELMQAAEPQYTVPTYVFDKDILDRHTARFRSILGGCADLCFAIKANPFMAGHMCDLTDRIEVCSMGEFRICRQLQLPQEKILISGVLKKKEDIREILSCYEDRCRYTAESVQQLELLNQWAVENGKTLLVYPRLSDHNQFGMDESTIRKIVAHMEAYPGIRLAGIHFFTGTQKRKVSLITKELDYMDTLLQELEQENGIRIPELEYGPGLAVSYFSKKEDTRYEDLGTIAERIRSMSWKGHVTLEMGRALSADCGYYITKVLDLKQNDDICYGIVDGGIHQINYDGQIRGMYIPKVSFYRPSAGELTDRSERYTICGSLCTVNDILVWDLPAPKLQLEDFLIFEKAGAYSALEGMALFLSHELPRVLSVSRKEGVRVLRETCETYRKNCEDMNDERRIAGNLK